jgi:hypothetical protein
MGLATALKLFRAEALMRMELHMLITPLFRSEQCVDPDNLMSRASVTTKCTTLRWCRYSSLLGTIVLALVAVDCVPQSISCEVITIDKTDTYDVLSRYGRSILGTDCPSRPPHEVRIGRDTYSVLLIFHANTTGQLYVGVQPRGSRFLLSGPALRDGIEDSIFREQTTHMYRTAWSTNHRLEFTVFDRETGKTDSFSFGINTVKCSCKLYDGP